MLQRSLRFSGSAVVSALLAAMIGGLASAQTTPAADAVAALCLTHGITLPTLMAQLDAEPGLTRLSPETLEPGGEHARALRMAQAWNIALEGMIGTDLIPPETLLQTEFARVEALSTADLLPYSEPDQTGGVLLYTDADDTLFVIQRAVTTGRQGRILLRCLLVTAEGQVPYTPNAPDFVVVTETPSISRLGFSVSAVRGEIPLALTFADAAPDSYGSFSMVTMPVPDGIPAAALARIGGVTIIGQSLTNATLH